MDQAMICGRMMYFEGISRKVLDMPTIAIVGSRNCTELGARIARSIAIYFATQGFSIVSGLASGIDAAAHQGAVDAGGKTIAVLGTPIDKIYPNPELARSIVASGGLLCSEYDRPEYDKARAKKRYTDRDKIIVDLSEAVIPVQAEIHSGTMLTTRYAISKKTPVFVPMPTSEDSERYPDRYAGLLSILKEYPGCDIAIGFRGKNDYPLLLEILEKRSL